MLGSSKTRKVLHRHVAVVSARHLLTSSGTIHGDTHLATPDPPPSTEPGSKETLPKMVACRSSNTASFRSGSLTTALRSSGNCNLWFGFMPPRSSWRVHCIQSLLLRDDVPQLCGPYFWPHHVGPSHLGFMKTHGWLYSRGSLTYNGESTAPSYFQMAKRTEGVAASVLTVIRIQIEWKSVFWPCGTQAA